MSSNVAACCVSSTVLFASFLGKELVFLVLEQLVMLALWSIGPSAPTIYLTAEPKNSQTFT